MQLALVLIKDVIILAIPYRVAVTTFPSIQGKKKKLITNHNMKYHESKNSGFQKGGVPAAPSGTATLLRLSPSHRLYPKTGYDPAL